MNSPSSAVALAKPSRRLHTLLALTVAVATLGLLGLSAERASAGAVITNGVVELGVNDHGQLNFCCKTEPGDHTDLVGLRVFETPGDTASRTFESTADGCPCEGWGVADGGTSVSGWANEEEGGPFNLSLVSFTSTASTAVSTVDVLDDSSTPIMRVTQDYHPAAATPQAYEDTVTITNLTGGTLTDLRYRRVMDWDIEPTQFFEFSTINHGAGDLRQVTNDGFDSANPLSPNDPITDEECDGGYDSGVSPAAGGGAEDLGPCDHGANFDFEFGSLAPSASKTFFVYYGGAASTTDAETPVETALAAIAAEHYSIGQSSTEGETSPTGTPASFFFAFGGTGAPPIEGKPGKVSARGTVTSDDLKTVKFSAANNCDKALSTRPSIVEWNSTRFTKTSVVSSSCFDDPAVPGTPSSGFDTQTFKMDGTLTGGAPATLEGKYVDGGPSASPADKAQFTVKDGGGTTLINVSIQTPGSLAGSPGGVWTFLP